MSEDRRWMRAEILDLAKRVMDAAQDSADFVMCDGQPTLYFGSDKEQFGLDLAAAVIEYLEGSLPGPAMRRKRESRSWKPVLAVDCDGTLLEYRKPPEFGPPIPGIIDELRKVKEAGWHIAIWTCRNDSQELRAHLEKHDVPFDFVNEYPYWPPDGSAKLSAEVYLDDRAMEFCGTTEGLAERILAFKPWYKRGG